MTWSSLRQFVYATQIAVWYILSFTDWKTTYSQTCHWYTCIKNIVFAWCQRMEKARTIVSYSLTFLLKLWTFLISTFLHCIFLDGCRSCCVWENCIVFWVYLSRFICFKCYMCCCPIHVMLKYIYWMCWSPSSIARQQKTQQLFYHKKYISTCYMRM